MQIIAIASYNPAKHLGETGIKAMDVRGRMQEGMVADITIFNPETIKDNATYEKGFAPSSGIPYVLINGTIIVKDSEVLRDVFPGQPIRFEPTTESKYEEVSADLWEDTYLVQPGAYLHDPTGCMHSMDDLVTQNSK